MKTKQPTSKSVFGELVQPLTGLIQQCNHKRSCKTLTDHEWIETGLLRTLSQEPSGRAFLQQQLDSGRSDLKRSLFFETLKSRRRLKLCKEVGLSLYEKIRQDICRDDLFENLSMLDGYDIYAGDGHYHAAAVHDKKKDGKKHPVQHFYSVDLRTNALRHLTLADTSGTRKREHDTRALKRLDLETLRQAAPKGRKVIYVWDRASIDFVQWLKWKHAAGIYFVSREKKNMESMVIAELPYDTKDPINTGVQRYDLIGCSGVSMCRIVYKCPISGETFGFVTSLSNVPPGLIAYLYKTRWDIEKIFDQVKNKLAEKKAWATSNTAKEMQAQFICMTHNLMLLLEDYLREEEGIENEIENKRRLQRLGETLAKITTDRDKLPFFLTRPKKPAQVSVKFIRWLRNNLNVNTSWMQALGTLQRMYTVF